MRILVVEDDDVLCVVLRDFFKYEMNFDCVCATTLDEAIEQAKKCTYDVYIIDWLLKNHRGTEAINFIRKHSPSSKIILISAMKGAEEEAKRLHVDYLAKPFDLDHLVQAIESVQKNKS